MLMAGPFHPPFSFCTAAKRERAVDGPREKTPRRVGLRRRRPPAAGEGWLAVPRGSQGRKRAALGETSSPGKSGIHPASLFAAAGRLLMKALARGKATASASAGQRVAKRNARKEELLKCVNHPDEVGTIRHGAAVPTSQKSIACPKAGPNRGRHRYADPRAHGGPLHRSAPSVFLFGPCTARFSFGKTKEKWGVHPAGQAPLREQRPGGRRPAAHIPGRQIAAPTAFTGGEFFQIRVTNPPPSGHI